MKKRYLTLGILMVGVALLYLSNYLAASKFLGYDIKLWILLIIGVTVAILNFFKVMMGLAYMIGGLVLAGFALIYAFFPEFMGSFSPNLIAWILLAVGAIVLIKGILTKSS